MLTDEMRAQGWIEHDGGPCPVDGGSRPTVMFRDGKVRTNNAYLWDHGQFSWWEHAEPLRRQCDIIAYKPETDHAA